MKTHDVLGHRFSIYNLFLLIIFLSGLMFVGAQSSKNSSNPQHLKIGDPIPNEIWKTTFTVINAPEKTLSLEKEKDKLILLDFWATWCSACIKNFPKMEALQKQFGDKLKIIAVTKQDHNMVSNYFNTPAGKRFNYTFSITGDKILNNLFPHFGVPYIVWIYNGKVMNTTDAEQVTEASIQEIISGQQSSLQTVVQLDEQKPLMLSEMFELEKETNLMNYSFFSKGKILGTGGGSFTFKKGKVIYGRQMFNAPLSKIYESVADQLFSQYHDQFYENRMLIQVKNPSHFDFSWGANEHEADFYNYAYIVPIAQADSLYSNMLQNLNKYSGYIGTIEKRSMKCLILVRTSQNDKIMTKGGEQVTQYSGLSDEKYTAKNIPISYLITEFNQKLVPSIAVINETGYAGNIDVNFSDIKNLTAVRRELARYDLDLKVAERPLYMLIIRDR